MQILRNTALRILLATNGVIILAGAMLGPIYALFVEEIGGDILDASFAGAVFAVSAGLVSFLMGKAGDDMKNKTWVIAFGYFLIGLSFFLYQFVDSMQTLLLVQLVFGAGEAIYSPMYDGLYSSHLDHGKESSEWGMWECMNYWFTALGALIGGYIAHKLGFDILFIVMSTLCFLAAIGTLASRKKLT